MSGAITLAGPPSPPPATNAPPPPATPAEPAAPPPRPPTPPTAFSRLTSPLAGHPPPTHPATPIPTDGGHLAMASDDTGLTGSSSANNQTLTADICDYLLLPATVTPEPASISLLGAAAVALLTRRRRR